MLETEASGPLESACAGYKRPRGEKQGEHTQKGRATWVPGSYVCLFYLCVISSSFHVCSISFGLSYCRLHNEENTNL